MRSYYKRSRNGLGSLRNLFAGAKNVVSNVAAGVSNTATDLKNKINQFALENPKLADALKQGGMDTLIDLQNKGIISQDMIDRITAKVASKQQPLPDPNKSGMSPLMIGGLIAVAIGTILLVNKNDE